MSFESVQKIADAVLYEGYMLYPYRPSSTKNRQRWTFGGLYPESYAAANGDSSSLQAEFLIEASGEVSLDVKTRFLHLLSREKDGQAWQEGMEREITFEDLSVSGLEARTQTVSFPHWRRVDEDGIAREQKAIDCAVDVDARKAGDFL